MPSMDGHESSENMIHFNFRGFALGVPRIFQTGKDLTVNVELTNLHINNKPDRARIIYGKIGMLHLIEVFLVVNNG